MSSHASPFPPTSQALLSAQGLRYAWPGQPRCVDLDLQIPAGLTVLTGDEGSGKTTLLRLLAGELTPDTGTIHWQGQAVAADALARLVAWTDPRTLAHDDTVIDDFLRETQQRFPATHQELLEDLLDGFALQEHRHKTFYMLSAGSRRKVWMAAAVASMAPVVLLDHPFAAIDAPSARVLNELLEDALDHPTRAVVMADYIAPAFVPAERIHPLDA